jgi:hypothetical protein
VQGKKNIGSTGKSVFFQIAVARSSLTDAIDAALPAADINCAQSLESMLPTVDLPRRRDWDPAWDRWEYMTRYRMYQVRAEGHINGPPTEFEIPTDEAAIELARHMLDGADTNSGKATGSFHWVQARTPSRALPLFPSRHSSPDLIGTDDENEVSSFSKYHPFPGPSDRSHGGRELASATLLRSAQSDKRSHCAGVEQYSAQQERDCYRAQHAEVAREKQEHYQFAEEGLKRVCKKYAVRSEADHVAPSSPRLRGQRWRL